MKRLFLHRKITPPPAKLERASTEMLIKMAANQSGLLSPEGIANLSAEIKSRKNDKNRA